MDGEIDPDELADLLDADADPAPNVDLRVVDIRSPREFARGHVPGSENIPFPELTTRVAELDGAERVVTVCPHGVASQQAAELVGSYAGTADARVESLRGGIEGWTGPLEAESQRSDGSEEEPDPPF